LTLGEWKTKIWQKLNSRPFFDPSKNDLIKDALQNALNQIYQDAPLYWAVEEITTVAGTSAYTFTSDFIELENENVYYYDNIVHLTNIPYFLMVKFQQNNGNTGDPLYFSIRRDGIKFTVIFYPIPGVSGRKIKFYGRIKRAEYTDSGTVDLPSQFILDVENLALSILYAEDNRFEVSAMYEQKYARRLEVIKTQAMNFRAPMFIK